MLVYAEGTHMLVYAEKELICFVQGFLDYYWDLHKATVMVKISLYSGIAHNSNKVITVSIPSLQSQ